VWLQRGFFGVALVLISYAGLMRADAYFFQQRESHSFERLRQQPVAVPVAFATAQGFIGRLEIKRLGLSVMVTEGDDQRTLRRAVGHVPGTSVPGQNGNIALTGHRDTFFRPLRNIRPDDIVELSTLQGQYRYRVVSTLVVSPDDVSVLNRGQREILTLITCHPFYFVGAAPNRFIVRAEKIQ